MNNKSKTVLITGASRGIGRACAIKFAKEGHMVLINYNKSLEKAQKLQEEIRALGGYCRIYHADVSSTAQVDNMFGEIEKDFGGVDILINNAGIAKTKLFSETTHDEWREVFSVNTDGIYNCTHRAIGYMINKKHGKIVNISSIWGICGASCEVAYSASKAAVIGFTKALAQEVGPSGICVNCVAPGVIDTDINSGLSKEDMEALSGQTPLCRTGNADEVAESVYFLASDKADFITGQVLSPNGGFVV